MKHVILMVICVFLNVGSFVFAAPQEEKKADQQEEQKVEKNVSVDAELLEISGTIDVKLAGAADWVEAKQGMKLPEGSEVCTGFDSTAIVMFHPKTKVTVSSLSTLKIDVHAQGKSAVETNLNVEFGQIELDVKKSNVSANVKVTTPNSTTSIGGTILIIRAFSDEMERGSAMHAAVRVSEGTVTVVSEIMWVEMNISAGEATTARMELPQRAIQYLQHNRSAPPLIGATLMELGLGGTSNTFIDALAAGQPIGDLQPTSSTVGERVTTQEVAIVLPGPPPPPPPAAP